MTDFDAAELAKMNGLFVGQLDPDELRVFNSAVEAGYARRSYEGSSGFLGLAKVRIAVLAQTEKGEG